MKAQMKSKKGMMPAGMYADGGMAKDDAKDKAMMKKVAAAKVKEHEAKMHGKKMADGGMVSNCGSTYGKNMKK